MTVYSSGKTIKAKTKRQAMETAQALAYENGGATVYNGKGRPVIAYSYTRGVGLSYVTC
jgi:hypothetical protein